MKQTILITTLICIATSNPLCAMKQPEKNIPAQACYDREKDSATFRFCNQQNAVAVCVKTRVGPDNIPHIENFSFIVNTKPRQPFAHKNAKKLVAESKDSALLLHDKTLMLEQEPHFSLKLKIKDDESGTLLHAPSSINRKLEDLFLGASRSLYENITTFMQQEKEYRDSFVRSSHPNIKSIAAIGFKCADTLEAVRSTIYKNPFKYPRLAKKLGLLVKKA